MKNREPRSVESRRKRGTASAHKSRYEFLGALTQPREIALMKAMQKLQIIADRIPAMLGVFAGDDPAYQSSLVSLVPDKSPSGEVRGIFILVTNITGAT